MNCPKCNKRISLTKWWESRVRRIDIVTEWQTKFVANNSTRGSKITAHPKYKQSERILYKLGFYSKFAKD